VSCRKGACFRGRTRRRWPLVPTAPRSQELLWCIDETQSSQGTLRNIWRVLQTRKSSQQSSYRHLRLHSPVTQCVSLNNGKKAHGRSVGASFCNLTKRTNILI
jgi:hypothetical protein